MAEINPPAWMQAGTYPARTDRLTVSSLLSYPGFLVDEATPTRIRQGVKPSYQQQQMKVRAAPTPNMTVLVSAGFVWVDNHDAGGAGTYVCVNDSDETLTVQPAGGAGQYRKDCVVASVYDAETAGSASEWKLEVIQGAYAASAGAAVRPSLPPNAVILADLAIGPSQASVAAGNITDVRNYSVAAGGVLPVTSSTAPNRPHPGQVMYLTNSDTFVYGKQDGSTANLLRSAGASDIGKPVFARKTESTARTSTTATDDPHLLFPVVANATYVLDGMIWMYTTDTGTADLLLDFGAPSGASGRWMGIGQPAAATVTDGTVRTATTDLTASRTYGAINSTADALGIRLSGIINTAGTAGNYSLQWGRSGASGTISLYQDSWLTLTRVA
ncbi:hypothetical protein [Streptomyces sp. or3]|uniref:hypothetical protein n=1 Tax=Streptomyces sp. or3 TaxID=1828020 RepID=UPI000BFE2F1D|nr:hypothetical protein [Streptomyces sp. or3]